MLEDKEISLAGLSVLIGIPTTRNLHPRTVASLLETQKVLDYHKVPNTTIMICGNAIIQWARDEVIDAFLSSGAQKLFMIDSDMAWDIRSFMQMLALSTKYDVICATYPSKTEPPQIHIHHDKDKVMIRDEYGLVEIRGAGLGFTIVDKEVIQKLSDNAPKVYCEIKKKEIPQIFRVGEIDGARYGEDMAFFADIKKLGYKVMLDPGIQLMHLGDKAYTADLIDSFDSNSGMYMGTQS